MRSINNNNYRSGRLLVLASALCLVQLPAHAQIGAEQGDTVETCQRIEELSSRLACFDRVFPPIDESAPAEPAPPAPAAAPPAPIADAEPVQSPEPVPAPRPAPAEPAAQAPAPQAVVSPPVAERDSSPQPAPAQEEQASDESIAHIVAVETPSVSSTYFHAADGRVFARERAQVRYSWPEPPFDAEIQVSRFGGMYLKLPNNLRVRVAVRD